MPITGTMTIHQDCERSLAELKGTPAALLMQSGYSANVGTISGLLGPGDVVISDETNHASIIMLTMIVWWFTEKGGLNLNSLNFVFLLLGFALYLNPIKYLNAIADSMRAVTGIVIQFPFYAAIMGIMTMSGLALTIAGWLTAIATPSTFPVVAWLTGGLVNMFIPSGGGEWVTIGEAINRAAMDLGIAPGQALIAYAAGDAWTNMLQPFWAIPLLAITGLKARNIFGYAIIVWLLATIPFALGLSFVPY